VSASVGVTAYVTVCVCMRGCVYVSDSVRVYVTVCVYMYHYAEVALPGEGSVRINTSGAGGTAITSAAKPKSRATAPTRVMRLGYSIVERARVRVDVGERVCAGAMASQKRPYM
jgi:hypothetical protein